MYWIQQRPERLADLLDAAGIPDVRPRPRIGPHKLDEVEHLTSRLVGRQLRHDLDCKLLEHGSVPVHNAPL